MTDTRAIAAAVCVAFWEAEHSGHTDNEIVNVVEGVLRSHLHAQAQDDAEHTRGILRATVRGYVAGESTDGKHWRARAEQAETALAACQRELGQTKALLDVLTNMDAMSARLDAAGSALSLSDRLEQAEAERDRLRRALEAHLCEDDIADWLACAGHPPSECDVCQGRGPHWHRLQQAEAERDRLRAAISEHRSVRADDRCIEDDDRLYEALGDGIKCDRHVGDKAAMLQNCERFIANRCEGGGWASYEELEQERDAAVSRMEQMKQSTDRDELLDRVEAAEAERDRLRGALDECLKIWDRERSGYAAPLDAWLAVSKSINAALAALPLTTAEADMEQARSIFHALQRQRDQLQADADRAALRILDLEDGVEEAQHTISFLHGCLTEPNYKYGYPEQTVRKLAELRKLYEPQPLCLHSVRTAGCPSCSMRRSRAEKRQAVVANIEENAMTGAGE